MEKAREYQKKHLFASLAMLKPLTVCITKNWKILKEMGISKHLTCLLRNLYVVKKQQLGLDIEQWTDSKLGKECDKVVYFHLAYWIYMQSTLCKVLGWINHKLQLRLPGETLKPQIWRWYHPYGKKWRGTKEPLDEGEREEWKSWVQTQHSKAKIMASGPITSGKQMGKKWKQWQTLFSWAPNSQWTMTATMKLKDACSLEEKLWQILPAY